MRLQGPDSHIYIDKNPLNFRHLGFLLELLPDARIIHLDRDGRDSCLSCYFQLFQHPDAGFANDTGDLVEYYQGYRKLMDHWRAHYPARILDIRYDELVDETRQSLEKVTAFLGVPESAEPGGEKGERAVRTASAWQARQPVYRRSLARWRHYHAFDPGFFDALADIDKPTGRAQDPADPAV